MESMETPLVPTKHALLRPDQVDEMVGEREVLEKKLHSKYVEDKGAVQEQLRRLDRQFEVQRAKPFASSDVDRAVKREAELKAQISDGMLSHEEMRKCPPGAVDRHRRWEAKNLDNITEWQNIQRRLNADNDDRESASIENFRPWTSHMNMDNALIPGKQYQLPPAGAGPVVTFNDAEIALLTKHAQDIALRLATLNNEQRAEVKKIIGALMAEQEQAA